jgi:hypothetical protein
MIKRSCLLKKTILVILSVLLAGSTIKSQNSVNSGYHIAEIYADFHFNTRNDDNKTGFSINRAYFGYNYIADKNFSANITLNIGNPEDLAPGSVDKRYAYFREASLTYAKDKLNMTLGMTTLRLFNFQQKFWGKRYIANTYQSINGYGLLADLGFVADYKFSEKVEVDLSVMNGEGYTRLQLDNAVKTGLGITITPVKEVAIRVFSDLLQTQGLWQATMVGFAGFKNENVTLGAEASYKSNLDLIKNHHAWGISGTAAVSLTKKLEFFTRYDYSTSIVAPGDVIQWNIYKDGQFLINGFQYTFNNIVKIAIDNQATFPKDKTRTISDLIFINALFKF